MAEPRSFKIEAQNVSEKVATVSTFGVLCVFISLVTILADLTTVILVFAEYCNRHYYYWAAATTIFILLPNVLINTFSLRWHLLDSKLKLRHWITHSIFFGLIERYVVFLHKAFWCKTFSEESKSMVRQAQQNDLNLLHYLYTFTGTVPQMLLQTYAIITLEENYQTKILSLYASSASVTWACITYVYSLTVADNDDVQWPSIFLQSLWHLCMLVARLAAILLFTILFGVWTLVPMGIHWAAMTFWIVTQKTTFCPNKFEETLYNVVMGFVYCFSYINLREGHTRYRLMLFYTMIITQNFASLLLYILISNVERQRWLWSIISTICIVAGTIIGICSMLLYYRWFHAKGPIIWKKSDNDIELNNKIPCSLRNNTTKNTGLTHVRSFKSLQKDKQISRKESTFSEISPQVEIETTDKKILLDHWIARSGTPTFVSAPIGNDSMDSSRIEIYTVENTPQVINIRPPQELPAIKEKKITICSPTELNLKLSLDNIESSIDEITLSNLNSKRRGICSSDELRANKLCLDDINLNIEEYKNKNDICSEISHDTDGSNKKTSSGSIDMDLDLSFSDINSSDINTFNENIVQKLCLSALKNIKVGNQDADIENIQKIALGILKGMQVKKGKNKKVNAELLSTTKRDLDTPTEMSVHDYENICAVNIAREAWGLRSWNVYSDIENWLHDGSVFRERIRDNLTSESSEISSLSNGFKNSILSTPSIFSSKRAPTYSNIILKFDNNNHNDYVNTTVCPSTSEDTYTAKPCLIDNKDMAQLEPILEELDNLGDIDYSKKTLNSEISLVATIDEIRKAMIANSPRNIHHRREYIWNSPELSTSAKLESNLKRALWKEPSKFDSSNIMVALPEKENNFNVAHTSKLNKKELNVAMSPQILDNNVHVPIESKRERRKHKSNNMQTQAKKLNNKMCDNKMLTNNDIDYLWNLVSENSASSASVEDLSQIPHFTSSLQSLILKDNLMPSSVTPRHKSFNVKRGNINNRPRRKFSILRERFEPRSYKKSQEEVLYQYGGNINSRVEPSTSYCVVNVKNKFDTDVRSECSQVYVEELMSKSAVEVSKSIKDKRSQFMKQVLSPPKFNTKLRHKF